MLHRALPLVFLVLSTATLSAQKTWIVDAAGGAGHHFKTLSGAVSAAAGGDILVVRKGLYLGTTVAKPLAILGEPGVVLRGSLTLQSIRSGSGSSVSGLQCEAGPYFYGHVVVDKCPGSIHLDGIDWGTVTVDSSAQVTMSRCRNIFLVVAKSAVTVTESSMLGQWGQYPRAGVEVRDNSQVILVGCSSKGAGGGCQFSPAPALDCRNSQVTIAGDARSSYEAGGQAVCKPSRSSSAIICDQGYPYGGSTLYIDPRVTLRPNKGAAPVLGRHSFKRSAALTIGPMRRGGSTTISLLGTSSDVALLFAGATGSVVTIPSLGSLWLDPGRMAHVGTILIPVTERWSTTATVPNHAALRGLAVSVQALVLGSTQAPAHLSNVATSVVH